MTFVVQYCVSGGLDGHMQYVEDWTDGAFTARRDGTDAAASVTVKIPHADAAAIEAGENNPNVLFMQGRLKVDGDMGQMMQVLRARHK